MATDVVNTFSDGLFDIYNRSNDLCKKGSQNGWPYCQTETGLRIFQEAAEPYVRGKAQSATPPSSPSITVRLESRSVWLLAVWPICVGALVVICCVLALAWRAHRQTPASPRLQHTKSEIAKTWREESEQAAQSLLAELRILNTNQAALVASQVQIGAGLAKLGETDAQLVDLASTQASATLGLAAAQTALAEEATNLVASLRQSSQQGIAKADSQRCADTVKLQKQIAAVAATLTASLGQTVRQKFAELDSQSRADTVKLQTQISKVVAGQQALLDRLGGPTNVPDLALALPGVRTKILGNSMLLIFDDGLFLHGAYFKPDAKSRLRAVAKALAQAPLPRRIDLIGCADDDRAFKSWSARFEGSLALERATAVVDYFIELGLFAPKRLAALSGGATDRPFPSDSVQNRAKNRTVVIRVSTGDAALQGCDGDSAPRVLEESSG